jgi:flagellar biosynthesis protein FlhG
MNDNKDLVPFRQQERAQIITVSGGKGGIGKTFFAVNFAVELKNRGYKVLIFDADINMANVNILLHIDENKKFQNFINNSISQEQLIKKGVGGVDAIYVGDDLTKILDIADDEYNKIISGLAKIEKDYDYIIIDTEAGLSKLNMKFMLLSDRVILLTNPEITALVDLYRVIKIMSLQKPGISLDIVVNKTPGAENAANVYQNIVETVSQFHLKTSLAFLGFILDDPKRVLESIQKRTPLLILNSSGSIRQCFQLLTTAFLKNAERKRRFQFFYSLLGRR